MGIDIYLHWEDMTEKDEEARYTGFSIVSGNIGYLREAYHGGPYVTRVLMPEAFYRDEWHEYAWRNQIDPSDWGNDPDDGSERDEHGPPIPAAVMRHRLTAARAAFDERWDSVYPDDDAEIRAEAWQAFVDFVDLAERKEKETGYMCRVYASY